MEKDSKKMRTILQFIGLLFTLIVSFLGILYILNGDIFFSSMVAITMVVLVYFLIDQMKERKIVITKNRFSSLSITLWVLYILLAIPLTFLLVHAMTVEILAKKDIQGKANDKVTIAETMISSYDNQVNKYLQGEFQPVLAQNLGQYVLNHSNYTALNILQSKPYNLEVSVLNSIRSNEVSQNIDKWVDVMRKNFDKARNEAKNRTEEFNEQYGNVFDNWSRLRLNIAFSELDKLIDENFQSLYAGFKKYNHVQGASFKFKYAKVEPLMNSPRKLWKSYNPALLIIASILFHILILLPYFLEPLPGHFRKQVDFDTTEASNGGFELK